MSSLGSRPPAKDSHSKGSKEAYALAPSEHQSRSSHQLSNHKEVLADKEDIQSKNSQKSRSSHQLSNHRKASADKEDVVSKRPSPGMGDATSFRQDMSGRGASAAVQFQRESVDRGKKLEDRSSKVTPALSNFDKELIQRRLRDSYSFGMSNREVEWITRIHAKIEGGKDSHGNLKPPPELKILGKNANAVKGQIVRHVSQGVHVPSQCDGDYLSGGDEGVVQDVCGDYAQIKWKNGNVRFYYIGKTPFRKDVDGNITDVPRALRCLVLMNKK